MATENEDSDFSTTLKKVGLKPAYWLPIFEKLEIDSAEALEFIDKDSEEYSELIKSARKDWEKKALKKLLKIEDKPAEEEEDKAEKEKNKEREKVRERQEKSNQTLKELKELNQQGKQRHDERVQKIENDVRQQFHISPDSWISKDKSLEELISKLELHQEKISGILQKRDGLSDSMVIRNASNGRALQGIFLCSDMNELIKDRLPLLKAPENIVLKGPSKPTVDIQESFTMKSQEDSYKKSVDVFGWGVSVSGKAPIYGGVTVEAGVSTSRRTEKETLHETHEQQTYSSTVKHSSLQLATYTFENRDLQLSTDALKALKEIKMLITTYGPDSSNVQSGCDDFFEKYGSHASRGPFHFGGIYWWTCSSTGFSETEINDVKELQSNAVTINAGVAFMGFGISTEVDITSVKSNYNGTCSKKTLAQTHLQVSITGGPPEVTSLPEWRTGLVGNNKTWSLTDRGTMLVPVWEIVTMNHGKELNRVVKVLKKSWERKTNLQAKRDTLTTSYSPETVMENIREWSPDQSLAHLEECLNYLLSAKNDLQDKSRNTQAWVEIYLSEPDLQKFLVTVMDQQTKPTTSEPSVYIKFLMQQVVEQQELRSLKTFPGKEGLAKWLYPPIAPKSLTQNECKDFKGLLRNLKKIEESMKIARAKSRQADNFVQNYHKTATSNVVLAVHSLRVNTRKSSDPKRMYDDIFIVTLVYPFLEEDVIGTSPTSPVLLKWLSVGDLRYLCSVLQEQTQAFNQKKTETTTNLQAYLFHLAIIMYNTKQGMHENQLREHLQYMKKAIGGELQPQVTEQLAIYEVKKCRLAALQDKLKKLMTTRGSSQCQHELKHGDSLNEILSSASKPTFYEAASTSQDLSVYGKPDIKELFTVLGLCQHYPKKLTMHDALCIRQLHSPDPNELYHLILHKIMTYDYLCRSNVLEGYSEKYPNSRIAKQEIHPLDGLLALVHCVDDILCQDLMCRLAVCQLGIPFILPDPFTNRLSLPLWTMNSIIKEWKRTTKDGTKKDEECPIITYKAPIISFLRFGKDEIHGKSKSKILNEVISDSHYEHFFHRDSDGGRFKRLLCDGLVEIGWYLPGGHTGNIFPDALAFLNLHGDARKHFCQTALLSQISSMSFIMLTEEDMNNESIDILKQFSIVQGGLVLLIENGKVPSRVQEALPDVVSIDLSRGESEVRKGIRKYINGKLSMLKSLKSLVECSDLIRCSNIWEIREIQVDISNPSFKDGSQLAYSLQQMIQKDIDISADAKLSMLPLQGEKLWHEWAKLNKEQHRQLKRGINSSPNDYTTQIESQKATIRSSQLQHIDSLKPVMKSFLTIILSHDWKVLQYFLLCLKLGLNNSSRKNIKELQREYQKARAILAAHQSKDPNDDGEEEESLVDEDIDLEDCKKTVEEMYEKLSNISFGLEHLLRELGQVYEAALHRLQELVSNLPPEVLDELPTGLSEISEEQIKSLPHLCLTKGTLKKLTSELRIFNLPRVAANLLINGYPLEVMDGDAAHVPIEWVKAVVNEVVHHLGDPRVFVLSVLGLQSTGKSTMLNTTFGVQFNVSAGRCTRGAYMQLLPVSKELKRETECSYVLIIDTEGLRAPELDSDQMQKHDNELATFVIGLASVTLINIYGEVPGDMDDILQTAIHAFIRMKKANLKPSCQFVHQNANNSSKGDVGRQKFVKKLNKMTSDAAKEEKLDFKKFSDVIKFNDREDVHHFPGLWMGEPPMAPVDRGYSESARKMKSHLVGLMKTNSVALSTFESRVDDLWDALLHEDFVFSFKNTLEVTAYNSLEAQYNKWDWEFQKAMMTWEEETENEIDVMDLEVITTEVDKKLEPGGDLDKEITKHHTDIKSKMAAYFKDSKQSDTLAQWRQRFELRLEGLATLLKDHAERVCKQRETGRKAMDEIELDGKDGNRSWIVNQVKEIIAKMKAEQDELRKNLEMNHLSIEQLKNMLDLLTPEQLVKFQESKVLTGKQVNHIRSNMPLTEEKLNSFLKSGVITTVQAQNILEQGLLNEEQLQDKFDIQWLELLQKLPKVQEEHINVEGEVRRKLFDYVGQKRKDKLLQKLSEKRLKQWGCCTPGNVHLTFTVEDKHVKKGWLQKIGVSGPPSMEKAQDVTDEVLKRAMGYLIDTCGNRNNSVRGKPKVKPTNFKPSFTQELLNKVKQAIDEQKEAAFTGEYYDELYLTVCGYAVNEFEKMVEAFRKRNNPRVYLQDEKEFLFTLFKSQYYQLALEKAVAGTICERFEKQIKAQVLLNIGKGVIDELTKGYKWFDNKSTLKAKVLLDLGENLSSGKSQALPDFFVYIKDAKRSLKQWLRYYTESYCTSQTAEGHCTCLESLAIKEVSYLIKFLGGEVKDVTSKAKKVIDEDGNVQLVAVAWMEELLKDKEITRKLGTIKLDINTFSGKLLTVDSFTKELMEGLEKLKIKLQGAFGSARFSDIDQKPYEILEKQLIGCCEQCPFCKEQCDWGEHEKSIKHKVRQHRPDCLGGYRKSSTNQMTVDLCSVLVVGDQRFKSGEMKDYRPYKEYNAPDLYPQWSIPGDNGAKASSYWKWIVGHYYTNVASYYNAVAPDVPDHWKGLKWEEVKRELKTQFNL